MKKTVSFILALLMLFSLATLLGCNSEPSEDATASGDTPSPGGNDAPEENPDGTAPDTGTGDAEITQETLENSKPNEYVPEKLAAGMEVIIAFSPTNLEGIGGPQDVRLQEELPKLGYTYTMTPFQGDAANHISLIENWVSMGVALILTHATDPELIKDVTSDAEEAGTSVVFYGTEPQFYCSGLTTVNLDWMGYSSALIARAWIDKTYPDAGEGEIKVAAFGSYVVTDLVTLTNALRRGIEDDPRCEIVFTHDECQGIDAGFTAAEEALTSNPDIRVIVSQDLYAAFGASNYVLSQPQYNPDEFCIVGTTTNQDVENFLELTANGGACFRGTTRGEADSAAGLLECVDGILIRGEEKPYAYYSQLTTLTSFEFDYETAFDTLYVAP